MARHARLDYQRRFQDAALTDPSLLEPGSTPVAEDEPVFLIRAQDELMLPTLHRYAQLAHSCGAQEVALRVLIFSEQVADWQETHKTKAPDIPPGEKNIT